MQNQERKNTILTRSDASYRGKEIATLRESEAKFRTLTETAEMAIFIHQGENFLHANRAAEVIGGYSVDEYLTDG